MSGGAVTATWTGNYARDPLAYIAGPPAVTPLECAVSNTAGQWLFAIASWRQDAGQSGTLAYPSTVTICDDASNFWVPLQSGQPDTGIVRTAVWMAPAARQAQWVYASPTGYQSAVTLEVLEVTADCPWYEVSVSSGTFSNQGTVISSSQDPASGLFSVGVIAWDNNSGTASFTDSSWLNWNTIAASNGTDHSGDLTQVTFLATTSGGTISLGGTISAVADLAETLVTVQGVSNAIGFPYGTLSMSGWPTLITEIAAAPVLNANPYMASGTQDWTATAGSLSAAPSWPLQVTSPLYQPGWIGSVQLTPSGTATTVSMTSELEPVSATSRYSALAMAYSQAGYSSAAAGIAWYSGTSPASLISVNSGTPQALAAASWTQLTAGPVQPPGAANYAAAVLSETAVSGSVPASAVLYAAYAAVAEATSYEGVPPDQITWNDISARNLAGQGQIQVARGIQYEQQSLEAGTMAMFLRNTDGEFTFGNWQSVLWPAAGDTDVPVRLRAVWPASLTPYYMLFSGFTDDIDFFWDDDAWYAIAQITASDVWSRLTAQMLTCDQQEVLQDAASLNLLGYWTCSQSAVNTAPGGVLPLTQSAAQTGAGSVSASFTSSQLNTPLPGTSGQACWQVQGVASGGINPSTGPGYALTYFPAATASALPPVSGGMTVAWWTQMVSGSGGQPSAHLALCTCFGGSHPLWTLFVDNTASGALKVTTWDKGTGATTTTTVSAGNFLASPGTNAYYFAVTFTQSSLTVLATVAPANLFGTTALTVTGLNMSAVATGFSWAGMLSPTGWSEDFMNGAFYGLELWQGTVPPARLAAHAAAAAGAFGPGPAFIGAESGGDSDCWRIARIAGYSGFPVPLAMRGLDLAQPALEAPPVASAADVDVITAATDTSGQVASAYLTNIASSTAAGMFVNGSGALVYRRRNEWFDRLTGQWALGQASAAQPLNANGSFTSGTSPWRAADNATLTAVAMPAGMPTPVFSTAGLMTGDGVTASPEIIYGITGGNPTPGVPVTPGDSHALSAWAWSPQGWASGLSLTLQWRTAAWSLISSVSAGPAALVAGSLTWLQIPATQAPATAAFAWLLLTASGTPAPAVQFYVTGVQLEYVPGVTAGGAAATALEVPYLPDVKASADRAQMFNQAIITQYGTQVQTRFSGTSLVFSPTSGVTVLTANNESAALRGPVPYTATLYLDNTVQALPYYLNEGSLEDAGNWVVQTSGSPLMRPETVTLTPMATPAAADMGMRMENGDTVTWRRTPAGAPDMRIQAYASQLRHQFDVQDEQQTWQVQAELSPLPGTSVLQCDDAVHGVLTGDSVLGW